MEKTNAESGKYWTLFYMHDLRRTFVTIAESLDISSFAVKALVNHKQGDDVDQRLYSNERGAIAATYADHY